MISSVLTSLIEANALPLFLFYCASPLTTERLWSSISYFDWTCTKEGREYWDALLTNRNTCMRPTQADIDYCKQHYPEYFI